MRKISLFIAASLDGYIATDSGNIDWLYADQDYGYSEFFAAVDTVIMGRKTYRHSLELAEDPYAGRQCIVLTQQSGTPPDANTRFISGAEVAETVEDLRRSPGNTIWLVGGAAVIQLFVQNDWLDELILSIHPVLLGEGIPLFPPTEIPLRWFTLQKTQPFDTGLIQLTYKRIRA
ncbi:MAG: dihydrofolate reductase family protein [Cyanobacteria bacterium J069]